jgi:hypothetical protein
MTVGGHRYQVVLRLSNFVHYLSNWFAASNYRACFYAQVLQHPTVGFHASFYFLPKHTVLIQGMRVDHMKKTNRGAVLLSEGYDVLDDRIIHG